MTNMYKLHNIIFMIVIRPITAYNEQIRNK